METVNLEKNYREACRTMLLSIDVRSALQALTGEVAGLHHALAEQGEQILAEPNNDQALQVYRRQVITMVAKLDERDEIRGKDVFGDALRQLLELGNQLGYARKAKQSSSPAEAAFTTVERELAQLQNQLATMHTVGA